MEIYDSFPQLKGFYDNGTSRCKVKFFFVKEIESRVWL